MTPPEGEKTSNPISVLQQKWSYPKFITDKAKTSILAIKKFEKRLANLVLHKRIPYRNHRNSVKELPDNLNKI